MDKNEFTELAYNNPRDALLALFTAVQRGDIERGTIVGTLDVLAQQNEQLLTIVEKQAAELDGLRATVLELATAVNAPAEA